MGTRRPPTNIYDVLHQIHRIFKFHNFFPFTFIGKPEHGRLETTRVDILGFLFWIGFSSILVILNMVSFNYDEMVLSTKLLQTADQMILIIGVLMGVLANIYQMRKRENIKMFLRILNHFDNKVSFSGKIFLLDF